MPDERPELCEGCGATLDPETAPWYDKFWICAQCKRLSITYGWLPAHAKAADLEKLSADLERWRRKRPYVVH